MPPTFAALEALPAAGVSINAAISPKPRRIDVALVLVKITPPPPAQRKGCFQSQARSGTSPWPWGGIAVVAAFLALRVGYVRWVGAVDSVYVVSRESLSAAAGRIPHVARVCLVKMLSPRRWGLLWPAFGLAALVLARRGSTSERSLALATAFSAGIFAAIFLFTTWPLDLHIEQAYPRLLAQLSPAAVVAVFAGWIRARRPESAEG